MAIEKNYLICVRGLQTSDGESERVELRTLGSYVQKGAAHYLVYDEYDQTSGRHAAHVTIKLEGDGCLLLQTGERRSRMELQKGRHTTCRYETMAGSLELSIFTRELEYAFEPKGGRLRMRYMVGTSAQPLGENEIRITVKEANKKDV